MEGESANMQIHITARHLSLTGPITAYLTRKVSKLERYFDHLVWANAIMSVEKQRHIAELVIHSPLHTMRAKAESLDLYSAIDLAVVKMEKQLKRLKEKWKSQKHLGVRTISRDTRGYYPVDTQAPENMGDDMVVKIANLWPTSISVVKQVPVAPTSVEGAIQTMESAGYNFWLFLNKGTKKINVIFKRADESYGILEPVKR